MPGFYLDASEKPWIRLDGYPTPDEVLNEDRPVRLRLINNRGNSQGELS